MTIFYSMERKEICYLVAHWARSLQDLMPALAEIGLIYPSKSLVLLSLLVVLSKRMGLLRTGMSSSNRK